MTKHLKWFACIKETDTLLNSTRSREEDDAAADFDNTILVMNDVRHTDDGRMEP